MVNIPRGWLIRAGLLAVVVAGVAYWRWPRPEREVRRRFELLSNWVSKEPGETTSVMVYKTQRLGELFADPCTLEVDRYGLAGTYSPEEISSHAARARPMVARMTLSFHDLHIRFPTKDSAEVEFTARWVAESDTGGPIEETAEVVGQVRRVDGKWLFHHFREVPVLRR